MGRIGMVERHKISKRPGVVLPAHSPQMIDLHLRSVGLPLTYDIGLYRDLRNRDRLVVKSNDCGSTRMRDFSSGDV